MVSQVRAPEPATDAAAIVENGDVLYLSDRGFEITATERPLFSPQLLMKGKNVSFDPISGSVSGSSADGAEARMLRDMLARFSADAHRLAGELFPRYRDRLTRARASFRPVEIAGRPSSWRKDDTRLHIDSFPATPVRGQRILRLFTNVNPAGRPRSWRIGEDFEEVSRRFAGKLHMPLPGTSGILRALRVTKTRRSAYDAIMLELHDAMKSDMSYQASAPQRTVDFAAGTTWIAFTDQVSHAAMAGQYQLEQTFLMPVDAMRDQARSPLRVLERLKGRPLV